MTALVKEGKKIWIDQDKTNFAILQAAGIKDNTFDDKTVVVKPSPITILKALKVRLQLLVLVLLLLSPSLSMGSEDMHGARH